jgi:hypothetical protein
MSGPPLASTSIGPIALNPMDEKTQCIYKRLGNADALTVPHIVATLATGSHHMIVYRSNATTENLTPTDCAPLGGILGGSDVPMVIATRDKADLQFPDNVGIALQPNQMLKIEMHMLDVGKTPLMATGTVSFEGKKSADAVGYQLADMAFWGTTQINIPPNGSLDTGPKFQKGIAGTHLFEISTHQHQYGTLMQVWASPSSTQIGTQLASDDNWAEPKFTIVNPIFDFDGTSGLTYECQWQNTSGSTVTFGESAATNEMCFAIGYYYPSHGFDVCFDGKCLANKR